jgi:uncharacterized protein (DUF2336 family)
MLLHKFFTWADGASPEQKASAAASLARAYLAGDFMHLDRPSMELALTALLDDYHQGVRLALAEVFADSTEAPRHVLLALATDSSDVASIVLAKSPLLSDEELVDCAAIGDTIAQVAVARRQRVSPSVAAALAEVGERESIVALLRNPRAEIADFSLRRIYERFGAQAEVREALIDFEGLPSDLRFEIADLTATLLEALVNAQGWLNQDRAARTVGDALHRVTVSIGSSAEDGARRLASHLRERGKLTPALLLRSLLSADRRLFDAALTELTGQPRSRVAGLIDNWVGGGFAALYAKANLPAPLLPAFRAALSAQDDESRRGRSDPVRLQRRLVERVLTSCENLGSAELAPVVALLRRLVCEAARDEARDETSMRQDSQWLPTSSVSIDLDALEAELIAA